MEFVHRCQLDHNIFGSSTTRQPKSANANANANANAIVQRGSPAESEGEARSI